MRIFLVAASPATRNLHRVSLVAASPATRNISICIYIHKYTIHGKKVMSVKALKSSCTDVRMFLVAAYPATRNLPPWWLPLQLPGILKYIYTYKRT